MNLGAIKSIVDRWTTPPALTPEAGLRYWQDRVILMLLFVAVFPGLLVYVPSVILSAREDLWHVVLGDTVLYLWAVILFFRRSLSYRTRAVSFVLILYVVGLILLWVVGPYSAGPVWIFACPVIAAALMGFRASLVALAVNAATLVVLGGLIAYGYPGWDYRLLHPVERWSVIVLNFMFLNTLVTIMVSRVLKGVQGLLEKEKTILASLEQKQAQLVETNRRLQREMTDRRQARTLLRESEERYRAISEYSHNAICIVDERGKIIWSNQQMVALAGYSLDRQYGADSFVEFLAPESVDFIVTNFRTFLAGKPYEHHYSFHIIRADGEKRLCEAHMMDFKDQYGKRNLVVSMLDITERKRLESQLLQAQKMEAIGTLSGGIAHDFNNMLSGMVGYTELAMMETDEGRRQRDLQQVLKSCERATDLVKQILSFSRKTDVEMKPVDVRHIVREAAKLIRAAIPSTIEVRQSVAPQPLIVLANPTQIHQVVMNLCTNAAHAMRAKGGVLDIGLSLLEVAKHSPIVLPGLSPGAYARLEVRDSGAGIEPAILDKIFDPFFTTKADSEGTGLGLSVVYGIVKGHGGTVTVHSEVGAGTAFTVFLPLIAGEEMVRESAAGEIPGGRERIFLVDDEPSLVALGEESLRRLGYDVFGFTDSVRALETFEKNPSVCDLVITDMTMPHMTGIDLSRAILKARAGMPVIVCTGHSDLIDEGSAKAEGIRELIIKPIHYKELAKVVRRLLDEMKAPS